MLQILLVWFVGSIYVLYIQREIDGHFCFFDQSIDEIIPSLDDKLRFYQLQYKLTDTPFKHVVHNLRAKKKKKKMAIALSIIMVHGDRLHWVFITIQKERSNLVPAVAQRMHYHHV